MRLEYTDTPSIWEKELASCAALPALYYGLPTAPFRRKGVGWHRKTEVIMSPI